MPSKYTSPSHPATGAPLTALEHLLLRLHFVALECHIWRRGFKAIPSPTGNPFVGDLVFVVSSYGTLAVAKFLELWGDLDKTAKNDSRLQQVMTTMTPAVSRLQMWPGMWQFRSQALAHPYSTREGQFIHPAHVLQQDGAPSHTAETSALIDLTRVCICVILQAFQNEYLAVEPLTNLGPRPATTKGITSGAQIGQEIGPIVAQVIANARSIGVDVHGFIFAHFDAVLQPDYPTPEVTTQ